MSDEKLEQESPEAEDEFAFGGDAESDSEQRPGVEAELPTEPIVSEVSKKKGSPVKLILLLLIVVGGAGAAFYLLGQDLSTPDTSVEIVAQQKPSKMKVPERSQPVEKPEGVKEEVVTVDKIAVVEKKSATVPASISPEILSFGLLSAGHLSSTRLKRVIGEVEKMGYKVRTSQKPELHKMTRLLVGLYDKPLADKRLSEVKKITDGAFLVGEEGKFAVYAGSFLFLNEARRLADILYRDGVRVQERQVEVELPSTTLRFGEFATRAEAEKVMLKMEKAGIDKLQIVQI